MLKLTGFKITDTTYVTKDTKETKPLKIIELYCLVDFSDKDHQYATVGGQRAVIERLQFTPQNVQHVKSLKLPINIHLQTAKDYSFADSKPYNASILEVK